MQQKLSLFEFEDRSAVEAVLLDQALAHLQPAPLDWVCPFYAEAPIAAAIIRGTLKPSAERRRSGGSIKDRVQDSVSEIARPMAFEAFKVNY